MDNELKALGKPVTTHIEILKRNSKGEVIEEKDGRGGARPGAGRPKGRKDTKTLERDHIRQAAIDRIHLNAHKLISAQMNKALGESYLMCQKTIGSGAKQRTETRIVTDPEIIRQYLDDELEEDNTEYYYMTTKPADNTALQGLLDRAFGKADSKVENVGEQKLIIETRKYAIDIPEAELIEDVDADD